MGAEKNHEQTCYAYGRVSSREQHLDRQLSAFCELGIPEKNIYIDRVSGKDFNRPAYRKLIRKLREGDILYVKSLDRFGRNYSQMLEEWRRITKTIGADIVILDMPLLDTLKYKDLTGTLISDIIISLLSYVAEQERAFIRQRQAEGIREAKARGVKFGRPAYLLPDDFSTHYARLKNGEITMAQLAKLLSISLSTAYNKVHLYELELRGDRK